MSPAAVVQGICDGAGAVVLASEAAVKEHSLTPLARLVGYAVAGVEPTIMGIGPAPAIRKLLEKSGLTLNDIALVEVRAGKTCSKRHSHMLMSSAIINDAGNAL